MFYSEKATSVFEKKAEVAFFRVKNQDSRVRIQESGGWLFEVWVTEFETKICFTK